jgi:hypothetical protein
MPLDLGPHQAERPRDGLAGCGRDKDKIVPRQRPGRERRRLQTWVPLDSAVHDHVDAISTASTISAN